MRKRCAALLLAVLLLGSLAAPALAAGSEPVTSTGTFWQAAAADSPRVIGNLIGIFSKGTCAVSEDRRHHGKVIRKADPVFGEPGAWLALCDYCGEEFKVYDDDMQNAYDEHVGQMQADYGTTYIDSNGLSRFYPSGWQYSVTNNSGLFITGLLTSRICFDVLVPSSKSGVALARSSDFVLPPGVYTFVMPDAISFSGLDDDDQDYFYCFLSGSNSGPMMSFYAPLGGSSSFTVLPDSAYYLSLRLSVPSFSSGFTCHYDCAPYIAGVPFFPVGSDFVSVDTRVGTFSGNFGYYGDDGQLVVAENIQIVNEGDKTFYNPATGTTAPVSDWTYDYSDRSYHLTLEGGDTVTVTYGDENVTINQGGDIYNIYYIVPGGGEVEPTPTPPPTDPPTPTETVSPTDPPGPTEPVDPDAPPDTTGWGILDFLKGIFDFLWGLGEKLMNLLQNLLMLLFMPKEESIKDLEDKVAEKLPFISDLQDFGDQFSDVLHNPAKSARSMTFTTVVDLGRKSGGVSYGSGQANILDMTWYLDYKPMVDDIIEGVAWLVFLWNLYGALPTIIHGGASGLHTTAGLVKWKEENDDVR